LAGGIAALAACDRGEVICSRAYFEFHGEGGAAPVIFGEEGDEPLLGATTLESLGLVLDPFKRRLIAMRLLPV
jgi:hypothetical protein